MPDTIQTATQKIRTKKEELLKDSIDLGKAKSAVLDAGYGGWYQEFENGNIYSHHAVGTYSVRSKTLRAYLDRGAMGMNPGLKRREFGFPTTDTIRTPDERFYMGKFEWGQVIQVAGTGGASISGEIYKVWSKGILEKMTEGEVESLMDGSDFAHLGYPINGNRKAEGGEVVYFERGFMFYDPDKSPAPLTVRIQPPLLGNPAIVTLDSPKLPVEVGGFFPNDIQKDIEKHGGNNLVLKLLEDRFSLQAVDDNIQIPIQIKLKTASPEQKTVPLVWTPAAPLKNRTLYHLMFKMDSGRYFPFSPNAVYARDSWKDFGLIHATDIHVAKRIDGFKDKLRAAKAKYKRTDLDEGIKHLNNWNDGFRDLVRYANFLHKEGILDGIIATGDIVDYQYEAGQSKLGGGNFEFLKQLILGQSEYPDGDFKVEALKVPIFTTLGNHDYRSNPYKLFAAATPGGSDVISIYVIKQYSEFNLTIDEGDAIQDGRAPVFVNQSFGNPVKNYYGRDNISLLEALRAIEIKQPHAYFNFINPEKSYIVELGKHRLVMLDSGPDTGLPEGRWDAFKIGMGYGGENKQTSRRGAPNSVGFGNKELQLTNRAQKETSPNGLLIIGTHSPLFNPQGSEFPHYFRETEHPKADEKEVANYLRRQVPTLTYQTDQQLHNDLLLKRVKKDFKDWPLTGTKYFKSGTHENYLDDGVSRGKTEQFLKICAGLENGSENGDAIRPVDLILYGHRHTRVEMRIKYDFAKKELQYFNDFYTDNPTSYYSSNKYMNETGYYKRVYIRIREQADPNPYDKKFGEIADPFWGRVPLLTIPPYSNPLNKSKDPVKWWQQHRPLFIQGAPLGPSDNNTRQDKDENENKSDPTFEGCRLIIVRNDVISKIIHLSRAELARETWQLPKGV